MPAAEPEVSGEVQALESIGDETPSFVLPNVPIESVFGSSKSVLETPRSVSVVSGEMLEEYGIENIEGLAAIVPNSYTSSAFGIAGSLDLRGTNGENYFRGMKRIENGGVYPTPIGATDRIDIVRGPPSPVFGPGKIGGYLNFVPKAARARTGKYLAKPTGRATVSLGSYDKRVVTAEQGGPLGGGNRQAGYYVYVLLENSESWYRNAGQDQLLVQSSFDVQLNDKWRLEFGEQYHYWKSIELSGLNRVTQALIDDGTYVSGLPAFNTDTNGDGITTPAEFNAAGGLAMSIPWGTDPSTIVLPATFALDPATVQTVMLDGSEIFADLGDFADATSAIFFLDVINDHNPNFTFTNKLIVDTLERVKDTTQGFATRADAFLVEDKVVIEHRLRPSDALQINNSYSASVRYFDGENRSAFLYQPFPRRDLYLGATAVDRVVSPVDDAATNAWDTNRQSEYWDYGVGVLSDITVNRKLNLILGARVDYLDIWAMADPNARFDGPATGERKTTGVSNTETAASYSASASYRVTDQFIPYVTHSQQQSLQIGNVGDIVPGNVAQPITDSELDEVGFKMSLFKNRLFGGVAAYRQTRSAINEQTFENFTTRGQGIEVELRYAPTEKLNISAAANWQKTIYLQAPTSFSMPPEFFGLTNEQAAGGSLTLTNIPTDIGFNERGGLPDKVISVFGTYSFRRGFGFTLGFVYQDKFSSGSGKTVTLPDVMKWDGSIFYGTDTWDVRFAVSNITDERYFQAINPDNIGNVIVLPKLPRTMEVTLGFKF